MIESRTCFKPMVTTFSAELLRLSNYWERGIFPRGGGLYDQPQVVLQAMPMIKDRRLAVQRAKQDRREQIAAMARR